MNNGDGSLYLEHANCCNGWAHMPVGYTNKTTNCALGLRLFAKPRIIITGGMPKISVKAMARLISESTYGVQKKTY